MMNVTDVIRDLGIPIMGDIVKALDLPEGPLVAFDLPGSEAIECWQTLRQRVSDTGHWPLLVGDLKNLEYLADLNRTNDLFAVSTVLQNAESLNFSAWLKEQAESDPDYFDFPRGEWPESMVIADDYYVHRGSSSGRPLHHVSLVLVPTLFSHTVPAFLRFGGWNECPLPEEHVAALLHWEEKFGVELVAIAGDILEVKVATPPSDRDVALQLAMEQYVYCADIVDQGTQTIDRLAAILVDNPRWFFWWD